MLDERIYEAIKLLEETTLFYKEIAERTGLSENTISNINRCKSHTTYHSYANNIRLECGKKQYIDVGENNPRRKLTEEQVKQIIELLKTSTLTAEQIGKQFNVSKSAINNINLRKNWRYLSQEFETNIRKEFKKLLEKRVRVK